MCNPDMLKELVLAGKRPVLFRLLHAGKISMAFQVRVIRIWMIAERAIMMYLRYCFATNPCHLRHMHGGFMT
jgi:hypothetical protein